MKYKVRELLDNNEIMSHLFLECVPTNDLVKITEREDYNIDTTDVTIEVKVNGKSVNPQKLFDQFVNQYDNLLRKEAVKLVNNQLSKKFNDMIAKLQDYQQITKSWASEINWQIENPLIKQNS